MTPRQRRATDHARVMRWQRATLLRLRVPFADVVTMTAAQAHHLGLYPRDRHGAPRRPQTAPPPAEPFTLAQELALLETFRAFTRPRDHEEAKARLHEIHRRKAGEP